MSTQTSWLEQFINLIHVAETCQELHQKGIVRPGLYPIDPDGKDENDEPITVVCDGGKTILGEIEEVEVVGCDSDFCFEYEQDGQVSSSQLNALLDGSLSCTQGLIYHCLSAPWKVMI